MFKYVLLKICFDLKKIYKYMGVFRFIMESYVSSCFNIVYLSSNNIIINDTIYAYMLNINSFNDKFYYVLISYWPIVK